MPECDVNDFHTSTWLPHHQHQHFENIIDMMDILHTAVNIGSQFWIIAYNNSFQNVLYFSFIQKRFTFQRNTVVQFYISKKYSIETLTSIHVI